MNGRDVSTQLRKGVVEGCVLAVLSNDPMHGWELARGLQSRGGIIGSIGTLYPILTRLEQAGQLSSREERAESGRRRRTYAITPAGRAQLAEFRQQWATFVADVSEVLDPEGTRQ